MIRFGIFIGCLVVLWKIFLAPNMVGKNTALPLVYKEKVFVASKSAPMPLVILLHGEGASEDDLLGLLSGTGLPHREIALRGPVPYSVGYTWYSSDEMFKDVAASIVRYAETFKAQYQTRGKPFLIGFSKGAEMAYYIAVTHPQTFRAVFAISGSLPAQLVPQSVVPGEEIPPVHAYHGTDDETVPVSSARATMESILKVSPASSLEEEPVAHTIHPLWRKKIAEKISEYVEGE